jgi:hypothetical protein
MEWGSGRDCRRNVCKRYFFVVDLTPGGFAVTIAERGRGDESVSTAEVFSWSELPELLAAEDLFEGAECDFTGRDASHDRIVARDDEDEDLDDDEEEDDDFDDEDDDYEEDEDDEEDGDEDDEEWEEVEDDEDEDDEEDGEEEDDGFEDEDEDEDWEDDEEDEDDDWGDDDED